MFLLWLLADRGRSGRRWRPHMVVLPFVGDDQHRGVLHRPLHMFPCRTSPHATALVVTPATPEEITCCKQKESLYVPTYTTETSGVMCKREDAWLATHNFRSSSRLQVRWGPGWKNWSAYVDWTNICGALSQAGSQLLLVLILKFKPKLENQYRKKEEPTLHIL